MTLPLDGIKILDLSRLLPGPYCTMMLADIGAEVIKVEEPDRGDYMRQVPPIYNKEGAVFMNLNRNKKSMTLNLKSKKGKEIFYKLAERSDVILEGFRPGVTKRLGIDYENIRKINQRIIYCSLSGYGQDGPYKEIVGHDINYIGIGGVLDITGKRNGPPVVPGVQIADIGAGGMQAAIGILTALLVREKTGKGQFIDISMLDGVVSWLSIPSATYFAKGKSPQRGELRNSGGSPFYNVYKTKDGKHVTIGATEGQFWGNLCKILGREDLVEYQLATGEKREEIFSFLRQTFLTKTRDEWVDELKYMDICFGSVNTIEEVFSDPQVLYRRMLVEIDHPTEGKIKQIGIPIKFSETPGEIRTPPPLFGQHTEEILKSLGYSEDKNKELKKEKVI